MVPPPCSRDTLGTPRCPVSAQHMGGGKGRREVGDQGRGMARPSPGHDSDPAAGAPCPRLRGSSHERWREVKRPCSGSVSD